MAKISDVVKFLLIKVIILGFILSLYLPAGCSENKGSSSGAGDGQSDADSEMGPDGEAGEIAGGGENGGDGESDRIAGDGGSDGDEEKAEGGGDGEEAEIPEGESEAEADYDYLLPEEPENRVVYELHGPTSLERRRPYNRIPFPYNHFTVADPASFTGLRVHLRLPEAYSIKVVNTNLIDQGLNFLKPENYQDAINTLDGFSNFGYAFFEVYPDLDESLLPQSPEESVSDESLVWLVQLQDGNPAFGRRIPIWVEKLESYEFGERIGDEDVHNYWYVALRPTSPLDGQTRYAVIVRRGLKTPGGRKLEPAVNFQIVAGMIPNDPGLPNAEHLAAERGRLKPVIDLIETEIGVAREQLLLAFDFTTQSATHDLMTIQEFITDNELPLPVPDFDVDQNGEPDVFTVDTYPDRDNGGDFPNIPSSMPGVGAVLHGTFDAVDFRSSWELEEEGRRRTFEHDENNDPIPLGEVEIPFILFLPENAALQPYPLVIVQHGIGNRKEGVCSLASDFAQRGWATLVMDFPYHGERPTRVIEALEFVDILSPLKAVSSFKQATVEHLQLIFMLRNWSEDLYPPGANDGVDLSTEKIGYLGTSLGGIVGGTTALVSPDLGASVINVGGAGLIDFVAQFLSDYGLTVVWPEQYLKQFSTVAQTVLDGGDGINFITFLDNPPPGYSEKAIIVQEAIDDQTVPNRVTENYARVARLPHLEPVERPVYGLEVVTPPVSRFGFTQFHPAGHELLWSGEFPEARARAREQVSHFLQTYFEDGEPEVINP